MAAEWNSSANVEMIGEDKNTIGEKNDSEQEEDEEEFFVLVSSSTPSTLNSLSDFAFLFQHEMLPRNCDPS